MFALRVAGSADVPAMAACRSDDAGAGPVDHRMAAYFDGHHHPQQALPPRIGFLALANGKALGYIAGHLTTRHGCQGEVQYLYVTPRYRRQGVATALLRRLAIWFQEQGALKVCVNVNPDSPPATPFYRALQATPINPHWSVWPDIGSVLDNPSTLPQP